MKSIVEEKKNDPIVALSKEAAQKIKLLAKKQQKTDSGMKIQAIPGGCAGFQYALYFDKEPSKEDIIIESHGVRLFLDRNSLHHLKGTRIHYIDNLYGSSFKFENPQETSTKSDLSVF